MEQCQCQSSFFHDPTSADVVKCVPCPGFAECPSVGTTVETLRVQPGHWRPSNSSLDARRCIFNTTCAGDVNMGNSTLPSDDANSFQAPQSQPYDAFSSTLCSPNTRTHGVYCTLCSNRYYFDAVEEDCRHCMDNLVKTIVVLLSLVGVCVVVAGLNEVHRTGILVSKRSLGTVLWERTVAAARQAALMQKAKLAISFYQIISHIAPVYHIIYPSDYRLFLRIVSVTSLAFDWLPGLHFSCFSIDNLYRRLVFMLVAPPSVCVLIILSRYAVHAARLVVEARQARITAKRGHQFDMTQELLAKHRSRAWASLPAILVPFVEALPLALFVLFLSFPSGASLGFRTITSCECFDLTAGGPDQTRGDEDTTRVDHYRDDEALARVCFSNVDLSYECDPSHRLVYSREWDLGLALIGVYSVAVPALFFILLLASRRAIVDGRPSLLSSALSFLHQEYHPAYWWWELAVAGQKVVLVGGLSLLLDGSELSVWQLDAAIFISLVFLTTQAIAAPFAARDLNVIGTFRQAALVFILVLSTKLSRYGERSGRGGSALSCLVNISEDAQERIVITVALFSSSVLVLLIAGAPACLASLRSPRSGCSAEITVSASSQPSWPAAAHACVPQSSYGTSSLCRSPKSPGRMAQPCACACCDLKSGTAS